MRAAKNSKFQTGRRRRREWRAANRFALRARLRANSCIDERETSKKFGLEIFRSWCAKEWEITRRTVRWVDKQRAPEAEMPCPWPSEGRLGPVSDGSESTPRPEFRTPFWVVGTRAQRRLSRPRRNYSSLARTHSACECIYWSVFFYLSGGATNEVDNLWS